MLAGRFFDDRSGARDRRLDARTRRPSPPGPGTFPTNGALFSALLVAVVVIVGALTFFPALSLGPIVEHFAAQAGKVF